MASHQCYNETYIDQNDIMQGPAACSQRVHLRIFLKELLKTCLIEWPSHYSLRRPL